jgi:diacylglycerol O-acyltransferase
MSRNRLTALDASFLEVETPTAHMHVGWAAAFGRPDGTRAPRFEELRDHVASRLARAALSPAGRRVPLGLADPVWVDDQAFDVAQHIYKARSGDLNEWADAVMSRPLERDHPPWELWIADRLGDGRVGVVGKVRRRRGRQRVQQRGPDRAADLL